MGLMPLARKRPVTKPQIAKGSKAKTFPAKGNFGTKEYTSDCQRLAAF